MLKAGVAQTAENNNLDLEQVDVYVECIGTFIRPRKETQRITLPCKVVGVGKDGRLTWPPQTKLAQLPTRSTLCVPNIK